MPRRTSPYPLPDSSLVAMPPDRLAAAGVTTIRQVYHIELDYSPESLASLDDLMQTAMRPGLYTSGTFPTALALTLGAYLGEVIRRIVSGGRWGMSIDNLYGTPLPFLIYEHEGREYQVNVVEDMLTYLWTGDGLPPSEEYAFHMEELRRIGIISS